MTEYTLHPDAILPWLKLAAYVIIALLAGIGTARLVWAVPQVVRDTTTDHKTGHFVFKDVAKFAALVVGVGIIALGAVADHVAGREVGQSGAALLLGYALGVGIQKTYESQLNRKTTDEAGNPLAQPGTADPPAAPVLMPQGTPTNNAAPDADQNPAAS